MDPKMLQALGSPIRVELLDLIVRGEVTSPKQLSIELGHWPKGLSQISYNVTVLREAGLIEETKTRSIRGATEHFYRATLPGRYLKWISTVLDSAGRKEALGAIGKCVAAIRRAHEKSANRLSKTESAGLPTTVVVANFASKKRPDGRDG